MILHSLRPIKIYLCGNNYYDKNKAHNKKDVILRGIMVGWLVGWLVTSTFCLIFNKSINVVIFLDKSINFIIFLNLTINNE